MDVSQRPVDEPRAEGSSSAVAEEVDEESREPHPWPHLKDYFTFNSRDESNENSMYFQCVLCQPKKTIIKGQLRSLFNLKSHIIRKHPAHVAQFNLEVKSGSLRGKHRLSVESSASAGSSSHSSQPPPKKARQPSLAESFFKSSSTGVRQSMVDRQIVDMFVQNMLPLHVVESPTFVGLIKLLNPSKSSMSRRTLGRRVLACMDSWKSI